MTSQKVQKICNDYLTLSKQIAESRKRNAEKREQQKKKKKKKKKKNNNISYDL